MATVSRLITSINRIVGEQVAPSVAIELINEGLRDLAEVARIPGKTVVAITDPAPGEVPIPSGVVELREVLFKFDAHPTRVFELPDIAEFHDISIFENQTLEWNIALPSEGSVIFRYYRTPNEVVNIEDVPEIDAEFHDALTHFAARELFDDQEEEERSIAENGKYQAKKGSYNAKTLARGTTGQVVRPSVVPPWMRPRG